VRDACFPTQSPACGLSTSICEGLRTEANEKNDKVRPGRCRRNVLAIRCFASHGLGRGEVVTSTEGIQEGETNKERIVIQFNIIPSQTQTHLS
jgi:hypothetical protein